MKFLKLFPIFFLLNIAFAQQTIKDLTVNDFKVENVKQGSKPCPLMTEIQRNAIPSPQNGRCIYNTTAGKLNIYNATAGIWKAAGGGVDAWVTAFGYSVDDLVIQSNKIYQCLTAHTSGTFATDLGLGRWLEISQGVTDHTQLTSIGTNTHAQIDTHIASTANPHAVTKAQVGLGSVVNVDTTTTANITDSTNKRFVTDTGLAVLATTSGTNTGDLLTQSQNGSQTTTSTLQAPYEQLTTTATGKTLIETGDQNVLRDPGAEGSAIAWSAYSDAAGVAPVDGTGGSPNVTATYSTTAPLAGKSSLILTKTAVNSQGQGISIPFTISPNMTMKVIRLSFDYSVLSGTYTDDQVEFFVHDITNNTIKPFTPSKLKNHSLVSERFNPNGEYQTSNSVSYRLIAHIAGTSASAYALKFDEFKLGVYEKTYGSLVTDWVLFTPSISNVTLGSGGISYGYYRKTGDSIDYKIGFILGTGGSVSGEISFTPPFAVDINKSRSNNVVGGSTAIAGTNNSGTSNLSGSGTNVVFKGWATGSNHNGTVPFSWAVNNSLHADFTLPTMGLSSSTIMSNDADTRVISARVSRGVTQSIPDSTVTVVQFDTIENDNIGMMDVVVNKGRATAKTNGLYRISPAINFTANATGNRAVNINKNGIFHSQLSTSIGTLAGSTTVSGTGEIELKAGDYIEISVFQNSGTALTIAAGGGAYTYYSISKISGPSQIAASETVSALYVGQPTGTLANAYNTATFPTKRNDSHSAYSGGSYTIRTAGLYDVTSQVRLESATASGTYFVALFIDGVQYAYSGVTSTTTFVHVPFSMANIPLLAGQVVSIRVLASTGTPVYSTSVEGNWFSISRSGNY